MKKHIVQVPQLPAFAAQRRPDRSSSQCENLKTPGTKFPISGDHIQVWIDDARVRILEASTVPRWWRCGLR